MRVAGGWEEGMRMRTERLGGRSEHGDEEVLRMEGMDGGRERCGGQGLQAQTFNHGFRTH